MDAKVLFAVFSACLVFAAQCEGDTVERWAAGGGHQQQRGSGGDEDMSNSNKLTVYFCQKRFLCHPGKRTCYCCLTLPKQSCYWDQHECWKVCPGGSPPYQPPSPAPASRQLDHSGVVILPSQSPGPGHRF